MRGQDNYLYCCLRLLKIIPLGNSRDIWRYELLTGFLNVSSECCLAKIMIVARQPTGTKTDDRSLLCQHVKCVLGSGGLVLGG